MVEGGAVTAAAGAMAVYYNLHARRNRTPEVQWTIAAVKSARTKGNKIGSAERLVMADCYFVCQEGARQKVIAERCKSVHAWIVGARIVDSVPAGLVGVPVTYNPYLSGELRRRDNGMAVQSAAYVAFGSDGRCTAYGVQ